MLTILVGGLLAVGLYQTQKDWRAGLYWMILLAAVQDPIRKMLPGTPAYYVMLSTPIWCMLGLRLWQTQPQIWDRFKQDFPAIGNAVALFVLALIVPAMISLSGPDNTWLLAIIGAFSYGSLIYGWVVGYAFMQSPEDNAKLMRFYVLVTAVALIGTPLEYLGLAPNWSAVGTQVLETTWVRTSWGLEVDLMSGFYRSPDIMGWHATSMVLFASILALTAKTFGHRALWVSLAAWGIAAAMVAGRRKMVMMMPLFAGMVVACYWFGGRLQKAVVTLGLMVVIAVGGFVAYQYIGASADVEEYYFTDIEDTTSDRLGVHAYQSVIQTVINGGFFGVGLGSTNRAARFLDTRKNLNLWQEGGLARIVAELGVPGTLMFLFLALVVFSTIVGLLRRQMQMQSSQFPYTVGLFCMVVANSGSFAISGQVFTDPFMLTFMAIIIGLVMSSVRVQVSEPAAHAAKPDLATGAVPKA